MVLKGFNLGKFARQVQVFMPPPKNWQDFQVLIGEVARVKYVSDSVQEYGCQGQKQNGVDIYATDVFDRKIGIQCKETKLEGLTTKMIDIEAKKAGNFSPPLDLYIIATTQKTNAKLQNHVNQLNDIKKYKFRIQLWFWDDINLYINLSRDVMSSFYAEFIDNFGVEEVKNHLSNLKIAFDRPAFKDNFLRESGYDDFEEALSSTKAMLKTGFLYDRWSRSLVTQVVPTSMIGDKDYREFVQSVERKLERIYQRFLRDKKIATTRNRHYEEVAGEYNISRRKIISFVNIRLEKEGIDSIEISY